MAWQQAAQQQALMQVQVDEPVSCSPGSRRGRGCGWCVVALAAVTGLVVGAVVVGCFMMLFTQEPKDGLKADIYKLRKSTETGRYDVFTTEKDANVLINGCLKIPNATEEEVSLKRLWNGSDRTISMKTAKETEICFFEEIMLTSGSRISISLKSNVTNSFFYVEELK